MPDPSQSQNHNNSLDTTAPARDGQEFFTTAKHLVTLFERGLDHGEKIVGWHGTSIEALELTLLQGRLPGSAVPHGAVPPGQIYFYSKSPADFQSAPNLEQAGGKAGAMRYATGNAQAAFAIKAMGLDFRNPRNHTLVREVLEHASGFDPHGDQAIATLNSLGITRDQAFAHAHAAFERQGILLALSAEIYYQCEVTDGDAGCNDSRIVAPKGLPLACIAGIEPLGEAEYNFFTTLQKLVGELESAPD